MKPTPGPAPSNSAAPAQMSRRNEPRHYAPRFNFEGVVWPEGIEVTSPSVVQHQALASSWAESKSNLAANAQASLAMFEAARTDGDVEGTRAWYAQFSKDNPTATGPMLDMINFELAHGNFPQVVALYEKALRGLGGSVGAVPGVDIWRQSLRSILRLALLRAYTDRTIWRYEQQGRTCITSEDRTRSPHLGPLMPARRTLSGRRSSGPTNWRSKRLGWTSPLDMSGESISPFWGRKR